MLHRIPGAARHRSAKYPRKRNCEMDVVLAGCDARKECSLAGEHCYAGGRHVARIPRSTARLAAVRALQETGNAVARRPKPQTCTIYFVGVLKC
jgi:hypothetical protein